MHFQRVRLAPLRIGAVVGTHRIPRIAQPTRMLRQDRTAHVQADVMPAVGIALDGARIDARFGFCDGLQQTHQCHSAGPLLPGDGCAAPTI